MADGNGTNGTPADKSGKMGMRGPDGKFLQGHPCISPGRPRGSLDLMDIARRKAKETGRSLEEIAWQIVLALSDKAIEDADPVRAKLVLDRLCGPVERASDVQVNVDARSVTGPPVPSTRELGRALKELRDAAMECLEVDPEDDEA